MMRYWYYGPWVPGSSDEDSDWTLPPGCTHGYDLRPVPDHSRRGGTPGMGIFCGLLDPQKVGGDYTLIGSGANWHDIKPTGPNAVAVRDGIAKSLCGRVKRVSAPDMVGIIWECFTAGADPDGFDGPKPLMPSRGVLEVRGPQRYSQRFRWGRGQHASLVRDVVRRDMSRLIGLAESGALNDSQHHRRVLDHLCQAYGVDDWTEFVSPREIRRVPGRLPHSTRYEDNFNRPDEALHASANWSLLNGDARVYQQQCAMNTPGGSLNNVRYRYDQDVSLPDHSVSLVVVYVDDFAAVGGIVRCSSSEDTGYSLVARADRSVIHRVSLGVSTLLATGPRTHNGSVLNCDIAGSSLALIDDGVSLIDASDTAITGHVRGGVTGKEPEALLDDWSIDDGGGTPGPGTTLIQLESTPRGVMRGVYRRGV
jgi:hypothetical protein